MSAVELIEQWSHIPAVLIAITGLIAMLESLAMVGLVVPGVVMLTAAASLAGHEQVPIAALIAAAFLGAVIGDGISYWLGRTQRRRVPHWWPFSRHPQWLEQGQRFFIRHGPLSVVLGRFIGPVRPIVPMVAGMMFMPPARFALFNLLSALAWAPVYLLPGYYLGRAWQSMIHLPAGVEQGLTALVLTLAALILILSWLRRRLARGSRLYGAVLRAARRHVVSRRLWLALRRRGVGGEVPLASLILAASALLAFALMGLWVAGLSQPPAFDVAIQQLAARLDSPMVSRLSLWLDRLGDSFGIAALLLPWLGWWLLQRRWAILLHWLGALALLAMSNTLFKALVGRVRPETPAHLIGSFSWPSAHTSSAVLVCGLGAAFAAERLSSAARRWPYWLALTPASLIALSRLTYGVHWLSDLIGGALLGLAICAATRVSYHLFAGPPQADSRPFTLAVLVFTSLLLAVLRILVLPAF
ncbi:bifunctional DedA family/phosphatase PAP2 family protein [Kushneria aurantia]|uniref:Bifunctional DedA family/phosphatase PAP2 family protein n=1 Tax=Kushneria aurantia TaxID=504092 RepID=A0ABV6G2M0_9GAMM|nr:bifunctional DedA family/phosphatase PAP2 family protein [Kushneria aurantia]